MSAIGYRVPAATRLSNGMRAVVPWNDDGGNAMYRHGHYEPETLRLFECLVSPGMTVFDVGANVGQYTLAASGRLSGWGEVHAFEPDPLTYAWLVRNARLNALPNVRAVQTAVYDTTEPLELYLATARDTGSNSLVGEPWTPAGKRVRVRCTTLDRYAAEHSIPRVDVIKVDVEGAELGVLRGAQRIVAGPHQPVMILEFEEERQRLAGTSCEALARHLVDRGYALYRIGAHGRALATDIRPPGSFNMLAVPVARVKSVFERIGWPAP
jgi:FkbM family methyltransferase